MIVFDEKLAILIAVATFLLTALTYLVSILIHRENKRRMYAESFQKCANSLFSSDEGEKITAAIFLRSFIQGKYKKECINLIVKSLRCKNSVTLQKTLADTISFSKQLNGQDFQYISMMEVLIKPQSAIDYELTKKESYKQKRLSMKCADFYHSIIVSSSLNFIDAEKAIFFCATLAGSSFKNCILKNANFQCTNVSGVKFDKDCVLDGAMFEGAVGLDQAVVIHNNNKVKLIDMLDENGIYNSCDSHGKYIEKKNKYVFISKLGVMDSFQQSHYNKIISLIENDQEIKTISIERGDYTDLAQLINVNGKMDDCCGCVIFAFDYLRVENGEVHRYIEGNDRKNINNKFFVSPWLHVEAALAYSKQLPCLIIYDEDLYRDGMFDDAIIGDHNSKLYALPYSDLITRDTDEIKQWKTEVQMKWMYNMK